MSNPEKKQSVLDIILRKYGEVRPIIPVIRLAQPSAEAFKTLEEALLRDDLPKSMDSGTL